MNTIQPLARAEQIRNGDFSQGGINWQVYGNVNFDEARCNISPEGSANQVLDSIPAGYYELSFRAAVVTAGSPPARVRLRHDSANTIVDVFGSTPQTYTARINLPTGANLSEIYLEAFGASAWFDDISLDLVPQSAELIQNGDFSEGRAHWDIGANFEQQTCKLGVDQVTQTVPVPTIGYYQLTARARAGAGSMGRLQIRGLPVGESHYKPISSSEWTEYVIDIGAVMGETHFMVELGRITNDDVEFDDVSLRLVASVNK